jgi:ABC-type antimicrobial peptide transport system permease subunit
MREAAVKNFKRKLSRFWKNLFDSKNQSIIEFFLLMVLVVSATGMGGWMMVSKVDATFRTIGTRFSSYIR